MSQSDRKNIRSKSESSQFKSNRRLDDDKRETKNVDKNLNLDNLYERSKYSNNNYDDILNSPDYHGDNYYYKYDNYNDYNYDSYLNDNKPYNILNDDKLLKDYLDRQSDLQPTKTLKEKEEELYNEYNLDDKYKINSDYNKSSLSSLDNYNTINGDSLNKYSLDRNNGYYDELSNLNRLEYDDYLKKNINTDDIGSRNSSDYYNDLKSYDDKDYFSKDYYNDNYYDDYKDDYKDYKDDYKDYKDDYKDYKDDYKDYRDDYKDYKDDYKDIGDSSNNYYNYTNYIYNNYFYNDGKYDDHYFDKYDIKKDNHSEYKNDLSRKLKLNELREESDIVDPKKKINFESNTKNRNNKERNKYDIKNNNYLRKPLNDKFNEIDRKIGKTISETRFGNYNSKTLNSRIYRAISNRSQDFVTKDIKRKSRGLSVTQKGPKNKFVIKGIKQKPPSVKDIRRREEKPKNQISKSTALSQIDNTEETSKIKNRSVNNNLVEIKCISARPSNSMNKPSIINSRTKDKNKSNDNPSNVTLVTISNVSNQNNTSKKTIDNNTVNKNNDNKNDNTNNTNNNTNNTNNANNTNNNTNNTNNNTNNIVTIDINANTNKNNDNNKNNKDNKMNVISIDLSSTNKTNNIKDSTNNKNNNDKNSNNNADNSKKNNDNNKEKNDKITTNETTSSTSIKLSNNVMVEVNKGKKVEKVYNSSTRLNNLQNNNIKRTITKKECETCHKQIETHLFKFHSNSHPTEIFRWLYLGTFDNACDIEELKRLKVTHILNVASECKNTKLPRRIKELHLNINDYEGFEIFDYFDEATEFLNQCKEDVGIALVHCKYGISRSVAFIIAYLIRYLKFSADSALEFLLKKRSKIKPNDGFMDQLREYEKEYS